MVEGISIEALIKLMSVSTALPERNSIIATWELVDDIGTLVHQEERPPRQSKRCGVILGDCPHERTLVGTGVSNIEPLRCSFNRAGLPKAASRHVRKARGGLRA